MLMKFMILVVLISLFDHNTFKHFFIHSHHADVLRTLFFFYNMIIYHNFQVYNNSNNNKYRNNVVTTLVRSGDVIICSYIYSVAIVSSIDQNFTNYWSSKMDRHRIYCELRILFKI